MYLTRGKAKKLSLANKMAESKTEETGQPSERVKLSPTWTEGSEGQQLIRHTLNPHTHPLGARPKSKKSIHASPLPLNLGSDTDNEVNEKGKVHKLDPDAKLSRLGAVGGKRFMSRKSSDKRLLPDVPPDSSVRKKDSSGRQHRDEAVGRDQRFRSSGLPRPNISKPVVMPDLFHGKGKVTLTSWLVHFEIVSEINDWQEEDQAKYMAMSLRDEALTALTESLSGDGLPSVEEIVEILKDNFDRPDTVSTYRQKFQARRRKPGESLTVLRHDLLRMARQAYPHASMAMIDDLAKEQFIVALDSQHLRMQVRREGPETLEVAYQVAFEEEKLWKEEESQFARRRNFSISAPEETSSKPEDDRVQQLEAQVQQLTQLVKELATKPPTRNRNRRGKPRSEIQCYGCGEYGHYRNECPKLPSSVQSMPTQHPSSKDNIDKQEN